MEDLLLASRIEPKGRLSLLLLLSRNPAVDASNNLVGIWSCPNVSSISSSDICSSISFSSQCIHIRLKVSEMEEENFQTQLLSKELQSERRRF